MNTTEAWLYDPTKTTYMGVPMLQLWVDLVLWEKFLNEHPVKYLFEIGTYKGGMSLFLAAQCLQRGIVFGTTDITRQPELESRLSQRLDLPRYFYEGDVFDLKKNNFLPKLLERGDCHPMLLYCDGGDKISEMRTFAPKLKPGDFVVMHDWEWEVKPKDVEIVERMLERVWFDECAEMKSMTRIWRKV